MQITDIEQEETDFDWFGVDADGFVAHFTTAGLKRLPRTVASDAEGLKMITAYFLNNAPIRCGHQLDDHLATRVPDWGGEQNEARYLSSFVSMADRGLFSFDIATYVKDDTAYFRVASPISPLPVDLLPQEIQVVLSRTVLYGIRLRSALTILYKDTITM